MLWGIPLPGNPILESWQAVEGADLASETLRQAQATAGIPLPSADPRRKLEGHRPDQASAGHSGSPAAALNPSAAGRLSLRDAQATADPCRETGRLQAGSGQRAVSGCRENPAAVADSLREIQRGNWKTAGGIRPAQATARIPQLSQIHSAGKNASGRGHRSGRSGRRRPSQSAARVTLPLFAQMRRKKRQRASQAVAARSTPPRGQIRPLRPHRMLWGIPLPGNPILESWQAVEGADLASETLRQAQATAGIPLPSRILCERSRRNLEGFRKIRPDQAGQTAAGQAQEAEKGHKKRRAALDDNKGQYATRQNHTCHTARMCGTKSIPYLFCAGKERKGQ